MAFFVAVFLVLSTRQGNAQPTVCQNCASSCEVELEQLAQDNDRLSVDVEQYRQTLYDKDAKLLQQANRESVGNCVHTSRGTRVCFNGTDVPEWKWNNFNDRDNIPLDKVESVFITGMTVHVRSWGGVEIVGAITVNYSTSISFTHGETRCTRRSHVFQLVTGDRITRIQAVSGLLVDSLTFYTKQKRQFGPYGGNGGNQQNIAAPTAERYLAYVKGMVSVLDGCQTIRHIHFAWGDPL